MPRANPPIAYDQSFFDRIRPGIQRSAEALVPLLVTELALLTTEQILIDVGCGEGWWGWEFAIWDFAVQGIDANPAEKMIRTIDHDLEKPLPEMGHFGIALCLEVAEHLTPQRGPSFIADLCRLSDLIVFSAAIPGQRGVDHKNERWPDYWVELFRANGYECSGALRWAIWEDERIESWYRQNLIIAAKYPERFPELFDTPLAPVFPVVHPAKWLERLEAEATPRIGRRIRG